ncbi:hypothetical protein ABEB36_014009 [Hypothenemus hampei]|uniref:MADF domain-containing protein n=1 Tax=Hypothenemus hampei TaxID=57062 RepID=A0ABD1E5R9_HYPHA
MENSCEEFRDESLLEAIFNCPPLYKKDCADYKSHLKKENCWQQVASSLNADVAVVKKRFKALREKYHRELKLESLATRSDAGASH